MIVVFLTRSGLHGVLLQSAAIIVAKKFWVDDKITALSKNMSPGCCMQSFK